MRSHTHMHRGSFTAADKATSAYLSAFAFACAREPCPLQMLVLCLCSVCAGKSFRLRRMFALFSVLFIWFHFISFFSFAAYLLDLPICGVLICYPVAAPFLLLSPSPSATPHFPIPRAGPWCWLVACGWGCGWFHCLHCQAPNPLAPSQNEPLKAMRFLASGHGDGVGVYQIKYLWKI